MDKKSVIGIPSHIGTADGLMFLSEKQKYSPVQKTEEYF